MVKNRYVWLDFLKIIACFFVIINHSHGLLFSTTDISSSSVLFDSIFFAVCKSAVPLFIMTSGYLLLKKEVPFKKTCQRIFRIIVPLLVLSLYYFWRLHIEPRTILNFIYTSLKEPVTTHLWYLYMLPGLYISAPFVTKIIKNSTNFELGLLVGTSLIIPSLTSIITTYSGYGFNSNWFFGLFPVTLGYFVAGVLLTRIAISRKYFWSAVALYLSSVIGFVLSVFLPYVKNGVFEYRLDSWQSFPVVISSLSLFYIFRYLFENKDFKKCSKIISEISLTTFGIYLIHCIAINKISSLSIIQSLFNINAYVGVIFVQISCFVGCSAVIFLLRKIPFVKSFL